MSSRKPALLGNALPLGVLLAVVAAVALPLVTAASIDHATGPGSPSRTADATARRQGGPPDAGPLDGRSSSVPSPPPSAFVGPEVCVSAEVTGAVGRVCARRYRFGATWVLELTDTGADDRQIRATIGLEVAQARDPSAALENDRGAGTTATINGSFDPRVGSALGDISIETCVVVRFGRDRCRTSSAALPQLASRATPAQAARLHRLAFEEPLDSFIAIWEQAWRSGVDASFDWRSDGCSAGPLAELLDERLEAACVRHDFAYRNLGQLLYGPTDPVRTRADEQLAADATTMGQAALAPGLLATLQRFAAPVFYGSDLATVWSAPDSLAPRSR